jgi:hypothetical protein
MLIIVHEDTMIVHSVVLKYKKKKMKHQREDVYERKNNNSDNFIYGSDAV